MKNCILNNFNLIKHLYFHKMLKKRTSKKYSLKKYKFKTKKIFKYALKKQKIFRLYILNPFSN